MPNFDEANLTNLKNGVDNWGELWYTMQVAAREREGKSGRRGRGAQS